MGDFSLEAIVPSLTAMAVTYLPKIALAIFTLIIGLFIIGKITKVFRSQLEKKELEPSVVGFVSSMVSVLLKVVLVISIAGIVGIQTTSFIAVLGSAGLAVGLALQGSLSNFAGGVLILIFKPFKVGQVISAQGYTAKVHEIQVFHTILKTPDNKTIILPNGGLANSPLTNFSTEPRRRVDMTFGIGYGDKIDQAKAVLARIIDADKRVLKAPDADAPFIAVAELADSSVNIVVRMWVESGDYFGVFFDMQEKVKVTFDEEGISIPFPQRDVHIHNS